MRQTFESALLVTVGVVFGWFLWGPSCPWWRSLELISLVYGISLISFLLLGVLCKEVPVDHAVLKKYTLVELLVVIAIMCAVMGAGLPAFVKMAKGNGISMESRNVPGKFRQAREFAITQRCYVAMIMPETTTTGGFYALADKNMLFTTYRFAVVNLIGGQFIFSRWIDGDSWIRMQTGTCISDVSAGACTPVRNVDLRDIQDPANYGDIVRCVIIKPIGSLYLTTPLTITLKEATNVGGVLTITNNLNAVTFSINPFIGSVKFIQ